MKIEFLGTGGAIPIPRPLCTCHICLEAKEKGVPYSRMGPSIFVHDLQLLIDTPEDIYQQVNRSTISEIKGVLYSHWHPDHVMGRRIIETISADWIQHPPKHKKVDVYLPEQVEKDFHTYLGSREHLTFFEWKGFAHTQIVHDGETLSLKGTTIFPFRLAEDYVYGFLFEQQNKRVLIVMDELNNWKPDPSLVGVDLAILPAGIFDIHPLTGERLLAEEHPVLEVEATFTETLEMIKELNAGRVILTHIEKVNGLSYRELKEVEIKLRALNIHVEFAYDTQIVTI
ncbi:MBL fold metallo-hydrolase [Metabacillus sp. HB246100]